MPTYTYECDDCEIVYEVVHRMTESPEVECDTCGKKCNKVILDVPCTVIPPGMQASPDKTKYYGIKDFRTGEGITADTDVRDPCGITRKQKKLKPREI